MVTLIAHCLLALASLQSAASTSESMIRVKVVGKPESGKGPVSVMVPSHWEFREKNWTLVKKDATYSRGSFGLEATPAGQKRIGISVSRYVGPDTLGSSVRESAKRTITKFAEGHEQSFREREVKFANAPVKVGDFSGNLMEFVMFPGQDKVRVKYDVLLRNSYHEFIYVSMQSFVPKPDPADKKLFLEIVSTIQVP